MLTIFLLISLAGPQSPPADFYTQGNDFLKKNDYAHAIEAFSNSLRLDPRSTSALFLRGLAYYRSNDDDHAIQDFTEAVRLNPEFGEAFRERAHAYADKTDYEHAIADYNQAIRLLSGVMRLRYERASAYEHAGEYGPAIADFTENILRLPHADAYRNRGRLRLYAGYTPDAQRDLSKAVEMDPKNYYSVIWLYIARTRGTTPGVASDELAKNSAKLDPKKWPGPVIQMFLGKSRPKAVLRAASAKDAQMNKAQQCEAKFYIGEYKALHGQSSAALKGYQLVQDTCPKNYFYYVPSAQQEMKALRKLPSSP